MPLDSLTNNNKRFNQRCLGWQLTFSWLPRYCYYSGKLLWFTLAYKGTAVAPLLIDSLFETRWCDRHEYLFLKLKGIIE